MSAKSDYKNKASLARKQVLIAINKGLASPIEAGVTIKLFNQIHSDCGAELAQLRMAQDYVDGGYRTQLENRDREVQGKAEIDFGTGYRLHTAGATCDCQLSETERGFVSAASRNESVETPLN